MPESSIPTSTPAPAPAPSSAPVSTPAPPTKSAPEPKVTYGAPDATETPAEHVSDTEEHVETIDDFGDESFDGPEVDEQTESTPEEFGTEAYQKLKAALAADPELFKQVKRAVSENKRFKEIAKSPEELRQTFDRLETLGGVEAIEQESQQWDTIYGMFATGDKGAIDYWKKENADGFDKAMPYAYQQWRDSPGWTHEVAKDFMATVHKSGLASILETVGQTGSAEQKALINKAIGIVNAINAHAEKSPERDLTPEHQQLNQEKQQVAKEKNELYRQGINTKILPVLNKSVINALNTQIRGRKLTPEQRSDLIGDIKREYYELARKDGDFQKNAKALLDANETDKFLRLTSSNMERTMPLAARRIWRKYAGISGLSTQEQQKRKTEASSMREAGGGGTTAAMTKTGPPDPRTVDWARMRAEFGRDKADEAFSFGLKSVHGGRRFYYVKGNEKGVFTF